jgi:hypothetical protein
VGLIGGRLVTHVARRSSEHAGSPEPVPRHPEGSCTNRRMPRRCGDTGLGALNLRRQEHHNPGLEVQPRRRPASHSCSGGTRRSRAAVIQAAAVGRLHTSSRWGGLRVAVEPVVRGAHGSYRLTARPASSPDLNPQQRIRAWWRRVMPHNDWCAASANRSPRGASAPMRWPAWVIRGGGSAGSHARHLAGHHWRPHRSAINAPSASHRLCTPEGQDRAGVRGSSATA